MRPKAGNGPEGLGRPAGGNVRRKDGREEKSSRARRARSRPKAGSEPEGVGSTAGERRVGRKPARGTSRGQQAAPSLTETPVVETGERSMDKRRSPTRALREREEADGEERAKQQQQQAAAGSSSSSSRQQQQQQAAVAAGSSSSRQQQQQQRRKENSERQVRWNRWDTAEENSWLTVDDLSLCSGMLKAYWAGIGKAPPAGALP